VNEIRAVVVEDHALTRAGLKTALTAAEIDVAGEAGDGVSAEDVIRAAAPDVVIVDLGLPGRDGIELTRAIKERNPATGVVILTMRQDAEHVFAALAAGADGYCVKSSDTSVVIDAVRAVAAGAAYFDPGVAHTVLARFDEHGAPPESSPLTPRELDVLRLIADGVSNAEIAERLHLGLGTVKGHVRDILEKLSASDRAHAAVIAFRRGFLR
jgi:two-component system, NarL family, response regulator LiaR